MKTNHLGMKSISTTLINSTGKLGVLFVVLLVIGYMLYRYYQPLCDSCLPGTECPPCRAKEQYIVVYLFGVLEIVILFRIIYLALRKK